MPSKSIDALLRALFADRGDARAADPEATARLERELLAAHERKYGRAASQPGWTTPWLLWRRGAVALLVLVLMSIGACQMPFDMRVTMGQRMRFVLPASAEIDARIQDIARRVEARSGATKVELMVHHDGGETVQLTLGVWGEHVDPDAVFTDLTAAFPALEILDSEAVPLEGTVHTTLGDKLRHDLFRLKLDERSLGDAKQAILEQLAADGFSGDADVQVFGEDDGSRRIEVRLRTDSYTTEDIEALRGEFEFELDVEDPQRERAPLQRGMRREVISDVTTVTKIVDSEEGTEDITVEHELTREQTP